MLDCQRSGTVYRSLSCCTGGGGSGWKNTLVQASSWCSPGSFVSLGPHQLTSHSKLTSWCLFYVSVTFARTAQVTRVHGNKYGGVAIFVKSFKKDFSEYNYIPSIQQWQDIRGRSEKLQNKIKIVNQRRGKINYLWQKHFQAFSCIVYPLLRYRHETAITQYTARRSRLKNPPCRYQ